MTSIMTGALSGDLTSVTKSIYKNFKDAKVNKLAMGWDLITNLDFVVHNTGTFTEQIINGLLDFTAEELNKKAHYYQTFLDISQKMLLSLLNKIIDTQLEPQFGATCLSV
ncbi:Dual specificity protein phosphatase CDC14B [Phytophthora cinnamomi]|nr:Dual specificity protein phosphatase CDC14B [Phytophthora cinnamomi]